MKRTTLTIGLFTVVMALTSFTTPETSTPTNDSSVITSIDGSGGQDSGRTRKLDYNGGGMKFSTTNQIADIDGSGGQDSGRTRKLD
ncbi:MAG TPA: hypothetical protein VFS71_18580 [Flavobacterium sp.]|uniref:hypothetical protein n=1 Tax=Flavobacterium sp. TaxID=239 RepID=UPI002DBAF473|nr:hypothetical protein [Flavobacterium sp.]HEU4791698.1 hypothetical protein [Flavobacterium sp.]